MLCVGYTDENRGATLFRHLEENRRYTIPILIIIVCTVDLDYDGQAHRIHQAVKSYTTLERLLIRVNRPV